MSTTGKQQSRSVTVEDVEHAIHVIREQVVTEENITSFFAIVKKISQSFIDIYQRLSFATYHQDAIEAYAKTRGLSVEHVRTFITNYDIVEQIKDMLKTNTLEDEKRSRSLSVSIEGLLDAFEFIVTHVQTAGDILSDIQRLFNAVATVESFTAQEKSSESTSRAMLRVTPEEQKVYQSFTLAEESITKYV